MDKTIRRNEICVVGLPRCDFVFSSTRTCFIAYGFENSPLEVAILTRLLADRGILAVEAGGALAPGQSAFCAKICSKIITSQFCIVLVNNDERDGQEIPNANVNMEYGLMLGFNKYVIPFQRSSQRLPFNVAGLDTVKYTENDFERRARAAIDQAEADTVQDAPPRIAPDQVIEAFLLARKALVTPTDTEGDRAIYRLGAPFGFNLLNDFSGMQYKFFGNFAALRAEAVLWRLSMLKEILDERLASLQIRIASGLLTEQQADVLRNLIRSIHVWVIVTSGEQKRSIEEALARAPLGYTTKIFSLEEVLDELQGLATPAGRNVNGAGN